MPGSIPVIEFCLCLRSSSPHRVLSLHPWWADGVGSRHRDASHPWSTVSQRTLLPGNALVIRFLPWLARKVLESGLQRKEAVLVICSEEVARGIVPNVTPHLGHTDRFLNGSIVDLISVGLRGGQEKKAAWGQTVPWELGVLEPCWPRQGFASVSGAHCSPGSMLVLGERHLALPAALQKAEHLRAPPGS